MNLGNISGEIFSSPLNIIYMVLYKCNNTLNMGSKFKDTGQGGGGRGVGFLGYAVQMSYRQTPDLPRLTKIWNGSIFGVMVGCTARWDTNVTLAHEDVKVFQSKYDKEVDSRQ